MPPDEPGAHSTIPPRPCGGNIDCKELVTGSTLYLPIAVAGTRYAMAKGTFRFLRARAIALEPRPGMSPAPPPFHAGAASFARPTRSVRIELPTPTGTMPALNEDPCGLFEA